MRKMRAAFERRCARLVLRGLAAALIIPACGVALRAEFVGGLNPTSFSVCDASMDSSGRLRSECEGSDVRFQSAAGAAESEFGFSVASGFLNGDEFSDLVVGDPKRNRVYVFFGRKTPDAAYLLDPNDLGDRMVDADTRADLILAREPAFPGQVASFGFSVAISPDRVAGTCPPDNSTAALLIGAPGHPGTTGNAPGTAFHIPANRFCDVPSDSPTAVVIDPIAAGGQSFQSPTAATDDEFGYSVRFGRLLTGTRDEPDAIVGARGAGDGDGEVIIFPVSSGQVSLPPAGLVRIRAGIGDGLGEVLAVGDLDADHDPNTLPLGNRDDLAIGAVGHANGKVVLIQGPVSPTDGMDGDGILREGVDPQLRSLVGERPGDYFGFSLAVSAEGALAVGAIYADNDPPNAQQPGAGDPLTNVGSGSRSNAGKVYVWDADVIGRSGIDTEASTADTVLVARRSGDQLGFSVVFADLDGSGDDDLAVAARREDGTALTINEIDQGTIYAIYDSSNLTSPVDLNLCTINSNCTGVSSMDVMIFGGDRGDGSGDEIGFSIAAGNFNGDRSSDLFVSSLTHRRVYAVTLEDTDADRLTQGRNLRDSDDDNDGAPDAEDCQPLSSTVNPDADEITCNGLDENCNGMDDDAPDADGDTWDVCNDNQPGDGDDKPADCNDADPTTHPGATEVCDGNDNDCSGAAPAVELDADGDLYVGCTDWNDSQGDNPTILGGGDCDRTDVLTFPGAAPQEAVPGACMRDRDGDDWGDATPPLGVTAGSDCDDSSTNAAVTFPGAAPLEPMSNACMKDLDGDDYGDVAVPPGVTRGTDCNDRDVASHPGAAEVCDGNDNACMGAVNASETDPDGDHYVACAGWNDSQEDNPSILGGGDCAPTDAFSFPGSAEQEPFSMACMKDRDGDGYGDLSPPAGITPGTDCDDTPSGGVTFPGAAQIEGPLNCMKDQDDDGWGDRTVVLPVVAGTDCNDAQASSFPGAAEIVDDGVDQDCNGVDAITCFVDLDGDGYGGSDTLVADDGLCDAAGESEFGTDCDDDNVTISPGATEIPEDGIDQDCNGADTILCFLDADRDGFGTIAGTMVQAGDGRCDSSQQEASAAGDCNDSDPMTFPAATQRCDGNDNTCSGVVPPNEMDLDGDGYVACAGWNDTQGDQPAILGGNDCDAGDGDTFPGSSPLEVFSSGCMRDKDHDDFGDIAPPAGVTRGTDCDDASPAGPFTFPGAAEIDGPLNCMRDRDEDGYGDATAALPVVKGTDCNDTEATTRPGAPEVCDGNDNDCSAGIPADEIDTDMDGWVACTGWSDTQGDNPAISGGGDCQPADPQTFPGAAAMEPFATACMQDKDGDDWGDATPPSGVVPGTDCDDDSGFAAVTFPGAAQIEAPLNCMKDLDDDGWGDSMVTLPVVPGTDCDDAEPSRFPGAPEVPADGIDQNCDGMDSLTCFADLDGDGYGSTDPLAPGDMDCSDPGESSVSSDCDDTEALIHPGAAETADDGIDQDCNGSDTVTCFVDADHDGHGTMAGTITLAPDGACDTFQGESTSSDDCNDANATVLPGGTEIPDDGIDQDCSGADAATCFVDGDGDGFGGVGQVISPDGDCTDPGEAAQGGDCNDGDGAIFPGAPELPGDGVDQDCDGADLLTCFQDADGDGYGSTTTVPPGDMDCADPGESPFNTDCNDASASIFPGATEVPDDGIDQDCSGTDAITCTLDADQDGFGTSLGTTVQAADGSCDTADQESATSNDCADNDATRHPGATEVPGDGIDQDCSGTDTITCFVDADHDGHGTPLMTTLLAPDGACDAAQGESATADDCNEGDATVFPGATEVPGDGTDQDCNGVDATSCFLDADQDGHGTAMGTTVVAGDGTCDTGQGESVTDDDCDDAAPLTFPGAAETPDDGIDQDCNGTDSVTCFVDSDGDGVGGSGTLTAGDGDCTDPGESALDTDCNDGNASIFPGATEIPGDGIDQDCDGADLLACFQDLDGDGYGSTTQLPAGDMDCTDPGESAFSTDCNDGAVGIHPGAAETPDDGIDQDCNGTDTVTCFVDADQDGHGTVMATTTLAADGTCDTAQGESTGSDDCLDSDAGVFPGATEVPNDGIDQDCSGGDLVLCFVDGDLDGFGGMDTMPPGDGDCNDPGESLLDTDCDDAEAGVFPGATETPDDGIDQDCSGSDTVTCYVDADGDGHGTSIGTIVLAADGSCDTPAGESPVADDCDDTDAASHPGAVEICDGNDNDCVGGVPADEVDGDGDGFAACAGWNDTQGDDPSIAGGGDCDALDGDTYPGAAPAEVFATACMRDKDGDDYGDLVKHPGVTQGTDCDDSSPTAAVTFPGAAEIEAPLNCMKDADDDGYGDTSVMLPIAPGGDCNDDDPVVHPFAPETCGDLIDSNCDGQDPVCVVAPPPEIGMSSEGDVSWAWDPRLQVESFNVYRGAVSEIRLTGEYTAIPGASPAAARFCSIPGSTLVDPWIPEVGEIAYYLVTTRTPAGESGLGADSTGYERPNAHPCGETIESAATTGTRRRQSAVAP